MIRRYIWLTPALAMLAFLPTATLQANVTDGVASYYGDRFDGRRTASGVRFDKNALTAAHRTLEFGTRVTVTNKANGRSVDVVINDRGPFSRGRTIDLSKAAAKEIGMLARGVAPVSLEVVDSGSPSRLTGKTIALADAERVLMDLF
ncbi:septal ring lytic transglycosylase RlpA family protein [Thiocapsa rosea]|uniref:Endolytic peptidoglycan transglycosylase RlpA n=1 Tax=Thiocapsa rosea TaxID=69360 RepID=A0A495VEN7_9GAMM|nr:septal ring lytic transglycosylase RlpA family protein [Thiocapsa rosea]RKT46905.1 rare lipoprotein A [Thiocapsa rosea]